MTSRSLPRSRTPHSMSFNKNSTHGTAWHLQRVQKKRRTPFCWTYSVVRRVRKPALISLKADWKSASAAYAPSKPLYPKTSTFTKASALALRRFYHKFHHQISATQRAVMKRTRFTMDPFVQKFGPSQCPETQFLLKGWNLCPVPEQLKVGEGIP